MYDRCAVTKWDYQAEYVVNDAYTLRERGPGYSVALYTLPEIFAMRGRFAQTRSGLATSQVLQAPCEADLPGLQKTRWPDLMLREDPPFKESRAMSASASDTSRSQAFRKTLRPSQSSGLEVGGGGAKLTATMRYKGRESRDVPPPVYIPPKLM